MSDNNHKPLSLPFSRPAAGKVEVGIFMPPAEDSSNRVVNELARKTAEETSNINLVLYRVQQPSDRRVEESPRLRKKRFLHSDLLRDVVFPYQNRLGLAGNPDNVLLSPELLAEKYQGRVRIVDVPNPNNPGFIAQHIDGNPDLKMAFSVRNLVIFKEPIIAAFARKGENSLVNLHPARLPDIRGLEGPFWSRAYGQPDLVTTMHVVDKGIDTGPILDYVVRAVNGMKEKAISIYPRSVAPDVANMIYKEIHLRHVLGSMRPPIQQPTGQSIVVTLPTDNELESAYQQGRIIFTDGSEQIQWMLNHYTDQDFKEGRHHSRLMQEIWGAYDRVKHTFNRDKTSNEQTLLEFPLSTTSGGSSTEHIPAPA